MALYAIQQSTTTWKLYFPLILSSDHVSPATGKSPTVVISKNGGAFGSPAGAVTELANGWYQVAGNATDTATLGPLLLHATEASSDPTDVVYEIVAYNPQDGVRLGLTALPNAAANAAGGLPISAAGALDMDDIGADVDAIETRVTTALPNAAPQAAGGLITSTAGSLDLDEMNVDIEAIQAKTDNLPAAPAAVSDIPTAIQNADALLDRNMATGADTNARSPRNALRFLRNKRATAAGVLTVTKEDDTSSAWTAALTTDPTAVPVITVDPA